MFWAAEYNDPNRAPNRHDLVHVEVFTGEGSTAEGTIGSRYEGEGVERPGVGEFESYCSFGGHGAHGHRVLFRSIDTWLDGVCVSHCKQCTWGEPPKNGGGSRLFAAECGQCDGAR